MIAEGMILPAGFKDTWREGRKDLDIDAIESGNVNSGRLIWGLNFVVGVRLLSLVWPLVTTWS